MKSPIFSNPMKSIRVVKIRVQDIIDWERYKLKQNKYRKTMANEDFLKVLEEIEKVIK